MTIVQRAEGNEAAAELDMGRGRQQKGMPVWWVRWPTGGEAQPGGGGGGGGGGGERGGGDGGGGGGGGGEGGGRRRGPTAPGLPAGAGLGRGVG